MATRRKLDPFGLVVHWDIDGAGEGDGIVIGTMKYDSDVWCVATEREHGMPINKLWCTYEEAQRVTAFAGTLRERYIEKYGDKFNEQN
jgi:hypothetical protein